jgi:beta-glucosidase
MIGEAASRSSLQLPGRQLDLLQGVVATGTPVVLLVLNGRPLDLRWAVDHVPAILDIWYPGSQGGTAVANLLLGDVTPGGKLPFAWRAPSGRSRSTTPTPPRTSRRIRAGVNGTRKAHRCSRSASA